MAERRPVVAANWKMHKSVAETRDFCAQIVPRAGEVEGVELFVCPPFTSLAVAVEACRESPVRIAAQNMHFAPEGAYTGEVSAAMLKELGVDGVIVGHSERRRDFGETDESVARKLPAALEAGLVPILCVGETAEERDADETERVLRGQVEADLGEVDEGRLRDVVIAYEPVWAIGTGRNATADQAAEAIDFIRSIVAVRDREASEALRILYGGSVKLENSAELLGRGEVDGALVGGASLDPDDFLAIAMAAR